MNDVLFPAIRDALMSVPAITAELSEWRGEPAIFTRRPIPEDGGDRIALINPPSAVSDMDGLTSDRPVVTTSIAFYGRKGTPGSDSDDTRAIDRAAGAARLHFHRQKFSMQPEGYSVITVIAGGPVNAPVDDETTVGRLLRLTIELRRAL